MKGYKGMTAYMYCRGMKYEIGKTYHEDNIALCKRGLHFCKNLNDVFLFYSREDGSRFFEVEATGKIMLGDYKCCTSDLTIVRELTDVEVNRNYYGKGYGFAYDNGNSCGNGFGNGFGYNFDWSSGDYCRAYAYGDGDGDGDGKRLGNSGKRIERYLIFKEV